MCDGLLTTITAHRAAVLEIVDGLSEEQLRTPVVPSGWTVIGLVEHVGWALTVWGDGAIRGQELVAPWPPGRSEDGTFTTDHPTDEVLAFFVDAGDRLDRTLRETPPDDEPRGEVPPDMADLATDVGTVAAHVLEELARHAGHLDIARELLDGRTGLGPR